MVYKVSEEDPPHIRPYADKFLTKVDNHHAKELTSCQMVCHLQSVFPKAAVIAALPSALSCIMSILVHQTGTFGLGHLSPAAEDNNVSGSFIWLVSFLVVFRVSQSYQRFWEGVSEIHLMRAEWFDACSNLVAFCKMSKATPEENNDFYNRLIRLVCLLHASALAEIEDCEREGHTEDELIETIDAFDFPLIDGEGIDAEGLQALGTVETKVELVYHWIQQLVIESIETGILYVPAPILTRCFQELGQGMVAFHACIKLTYVPFPLAYSQTCVWLLTTHWVISPFLVAIATSSPIWSFLFCFIQVFTLWTLNFVAEKLENPFGSDIYDLNREKMHFELNQQLLMLLRPFAFRTPKLAPSAQDLTCKNLITTPETIRSEPSYRAIWLKQKAKKQAIEMFKSDIEPLKKKPEAKMQNLNTSGGHRPKTSSASDYDRGSTHHGRVKSYHSPDSGSPEPTKVIVRRPDDNHDSKMKANLTLDASFGSTPAKLRHDAVDDLKSNMMGISQPKVSPEDALRAKLGTQIDEELGLLEDHRGRGEVLHAMSRERSSPGRERSITDEEVTDIRVASPHKKKAWKHKKGSTHSIMPAASRLRPEGNEVFDMRQAATEYSGVATSHSGALEASSGDGIARPQLADPARYRRSPRPSPRERLNGAETAPC